jgi:threonine synthase
MTHIAGLRCVHCGREYTPDQAEYYCEPCGYHDGILDVLYDYDAIEKELNPATLSANREESMWRYLPLLPICQPALIPLLRVGWTPLYAAPELARHLGIAACWIKDEGRNPTASFKDRASAAINPYLIEGKKTVSLELAEQFRNLTPGTFPDWVMVSVGDGCTIGGVWKGLREMYRLGFMPALPKVLGVQAEGCQPFVTAWREGGGLKPTDANTVADFIAVGHPRNFRKGMNAVTESGGAFVAVSDQAILDSIKTLARRAGVFGEPAGVAGVAGVKQALAAGIIHPGESVAIIITSNGLKDIQSAIRAASQPIPIAPDMAEVRKAISGSCG